MMTMCELTLVGLGGDVVLEFVTTVDELALIRAEGGDGLSEEVDDVFVLSSLLLLHPFGLLRFDISNDGGNLIIQLVLVSA